jgi:membrane protease YdiL (CAAX protease family)
MDSQVPPIDPTIPPADVLVAPPPPPQPSIVYKIFLGPYGVRAGWKILMYIALFIALGFLMRPFFRMLPHMDPKAPMAPWTAFWAEFFQMVMVLVPTGILAKLVDHKKWGYFGMPLNKAFRANFWIGGFIGLGALALQLEIMHLCGWFDFGTVQLNGADALKFGSIWFVMFIFVGFTEEGLLRGYVQRVTTDGFSMMPGGWGFWTSAIIFSILFASGHLGNAGENKFGIFMVFTDGMVMCFSLWRTGDLWWAIGNHAMWDWGQSFLFGTPNSGTHSIGALMNPSFHGPELLAGGTDGPEGSVLVLLSEAIFVVLIAVMYRQRKFPLIKEEATVSTKPAYTSDMA